MGPNSLNNDDAFRDKNAINEVAIRYKNTNTAYLLYRTINTCIRVGFMWNTCLIDMWCRNQTMI
jgi:hypothetical protein